MNATARAKARQRKKQFLKDKGPMFPTSKHTAKAGKLTRKFFRKHQYLTGDYFHDEPSVLGFCDARMRVTTPPATGRSTGKVLGWVRKGIARQMNKTIPVNQLVVCPSKLED
jgi:hypothetical protein